MVNCAKATDIKGIKRGNAVYKMNTGVASKNKQKKKHTLDFITLIDTLLLIFRFPMDYLVCFKTEYRKDFQICKWEFKHPGATHIFTSCNSWVLNLFDGILSPLSSPPRLKFKEDCKLYKVLWLSFMKPVSTIIFQETCLPMKASSCIRMLCRWWQIYLINFGWDAY